MVDMPVFISARECGRVTEREVDALAGAASEFLLYTAPDGDVRVQVLLRNETVWLPQKRLAEIFG